jgi:serine/threonine-protein kinase
MASLPHEELLPVLVADLADESSKEILDAAAFAGRRVYVPLGSAPVSASLHVLEVTFPTRSEPLLYLAEPLGPPTAEGFPLRIRTMPHATPATPSDAPVADHVLRARRPSVPMMLSESHAKDLARGVAEREGEELLVGRALAGGKLKIEQLIGRGGVGAVYKARHRELKMPVAVKVLRESFQHDIDFCRRFYAEALAASRLDHPNVTRVIDFGQEPDGLLYLAMEYLDGVELRSVIHEAGPLPTERIVEIVAQVCAGLSHAHARGIVHRDIKPENLVLMPGQDDDGRRIEVVKVCDFGIAQHRALRRMGDEGSVAGTPEYMSPEQCRGDELDERSDVYAVGVVLYELATGQIPFRAERPQSILNKHQFTPPPPPSQIRADVDPTLEAIILKALAKEPADRQQSMRELRAELRDVLASLDASASVREISPAPASVRTPPASVRTPPAPPKPPPLPKAAARSSTPRRDEPAPDWLERGGAFTPARGGGAAPASTARAASRQGAPGEGSEIADQLEASAAAWMQRFAKTPDPRAFAHIAQRLEPAVRALAARGAMSALWAVSSALHTIAAEGTHAAGSRAHVASRVLRVFDEPPVLATIAEVLLGGAGETRDDARRLLVHAGVAGAYGLYGARVKLANDPAIRAPFVAALKDFGPKAWPVVRAALEKIQGAQEWTRSTAELAEDLLLCVPSVGDEASGHLVVKYLRANVSGPCRAATAAIVKLWGERSKPMLIGMLQAKDDVVRIAGIAGLRQLGAIDEQVVPRLSAILTRRVPASEDLRVAAAVALAHATRSAQQPAISILTQLVTGTRDGPRVDTPAGDDLTREDAVVVALARSLLALGGKSYRTLVSERAERSREPLRAQLRMLLT